MPMVIGIFASEAFIDWIKHGFIVKFNNIPIEVRFLVLKSID
jgi:hypothetical protein